MSRYNEKFVPQHFAKTLDKFAKEVLSQEVYEARGVKGLQLMDIKILYFIDDFRGNIKVPITVNDWSWGGGFNQSGIRKPKEGSYSQHFYGNAVDFRTRHKTGHELRKHFIENKEEYPQISFVEVGPVEKTIEGKKQWVDMTWFHGDTRTRTDWEGVRYWSPKHGFVTEEFVLENEL
jgi:hypothetical protein